MRPAIRLAAIFGLVAAPSLAQAELTLAVRAVDATRCAQDGTITLELEELSLEGEVNDVPASAFRLVLDDITRAEPPTTALNLSAADVPLSVAVVLQADLTYRSDFEAITRATRGFLRGLPARSRVWIWTAGDAVIARATDANPDLAADGIAQIFAHDRPTRVMFQAWDEARRTLASAPGRRFLVVITDGKNEAPDRGTIRALGDRLKQEGIALMPVAYSPTDDREPMLHLGELAKRSFGTFRLSTSLSDLGVQLGNLEAQISGRLRLEFAVPDRCQAPHQVQIGHGALRSEPHPLPAQAPPPLPLGLYATAFGAALLVMALGFFAYRRWRMG